MKKLVMVALMIGGMAYGQELSPLAVEVAADGSGAMVGVDMLAGTNADGKREQSWGKAVMQGISTHKWKILGGIAGAVAVDQLILKEHDLLWYDEGAPKPAKKTDTQDQAAKPEPEPKPGSTSQNNGGDGSNTRTDIDIETGDNSPVTINIGSVQQ